MGRAYLSERATGGAVASPYVGGLGGSAPLLVRFLGASEKMNKTLFLLLKRVVERVAVSRRAFQPHRRAADRHRAAYHPAAAALRRERAAAHAPLPAQPEAAAAALVGAVAADGQLHALHRVRRAAAAVLRVPPVLARRAYPRAHRLRQVHDLPAVLIVTTTAAGRKSCANQHTH